MIVADLPPAMQEKVVCSVQAAVKFNVPANAVLAISDMEGGKPGQKVKNTNGTFDVGTMQFNTSYLKTLSQFGITAEDVAAEGCYPYDLAAWRISQHIVKDSGSFWQKVANYHSRTPVYNERYRKGLVQKAAKWNDWIQSNLLQKQAAAPIDLDIPPKPYADPTTITVAELPKEKIVLAPVPEGTIASKMVAARNNGRGSNKGQSLASSYQQALTASSSISVNIASSD